MRLDRELQARSVAGATPDAKIARRIQINSQSDDEQRE